MFKKNSPEAKTYSMVSLDFRHCPMNTACIQIRSIFMAREKFEMVTTEMRHSGLRNAHANMNSFETLESMNIKFPPP